jgi:hypothetical protein
VKYALALGMLLAATAALADNRVEVAFWGPDAPGNNAERFVHLSMRPTAGRDGLTIFAHAYDKASGVKSIAITSGVKVLGTCNADTCSATWLKSAMGATNDMLVTVTPVKGAKFTMPTRVSRP